MIRRPTPALVWLLGSFSVLSGSALAQVDTTPSEPVDAAPPSSSPPPVATTPAPPPATAPAAASPNALEQTGWLRAGAGIGAVTVGPGGIAYTPGLFAIAEACPSGGLCFFGSLRGTATTYPSSGLVGSTPIPFTTSSLVSLALTAGARYVLTPGAPVEISPWLSLGVGGGFAEGTSVTGFDPGTGAPVSNQLGIVGVDGAVTVGVLAEREVWDGIRVRASTSLLSGNMAWNNVYAAGTSGGGALHFGVDLVLRPSVGLVLEL